MLQLRELYLLQEHTAPPDITSKESLRLSGKPKGHFHSFQDCRQQQSLRFMSRGPPAFWREQGPGASPQRLQPGIHGGTSSVSPTPSPALLEARAPLTMGTSPCRKCLWVPIPRTAPSCPDPHTAGLHQGRRSPRPQPCTLLPGEAPPAQQGARRARRPHHIGSSSLAGAVFTQRLNRKGQSTQGLTARISGL